MTAIKAMKETKVMTKLLSVPDLTQVTFSAGMAMENLVYLDG